MVKKIIQLFNENNKTNHRTRQNKSIVKLIGKPELEAWDLYKVQAPPRLV